MDIRKVSINPWAVTLPLALVAAFLAVVSLSLASYWILSQQEYVTGFALLSLDKEESIPALFSTFLLFADAIVLLFVATLERDSRDGRKWQLLALGFTVMAMDENLALHERIIEPMRHLLGGGKGGSHLGIFYFAWVIPALGMIAVLGAYFLPFLLRLPRRTMFALMTAAAVYLGGAVGVELIEGWWREGHGYRTLGFHLLVTLEESMEMAGAILLIHALLRHLARRFGDVQLHFEGAAAEETMYAPSPTAPSSVQAASPHAP
ncbi:hypothetical protein [Lysobacter solisilvae (ex Woo and Kim 2020)]|uniref:Uncharacterized protein n=1 Tax=Agrilutibacter terrestris TaxID=2865112 RepID=A0A7H0FXB5_9GAMM|nr:hypothetical protein [Lysobacter terrestris]QNP40681.1 hypothetical protein H8B22_14680 [Lysobacter terrestris]